MAISKTYLSECKLKTDKDIIKLGMYGRLK